MFNAQPTGTVISRDTHFIAHSLLQNKTWFLEHVKTFASIVASFVVVVVGFGGGGLEGGWCVLLKNFFFFFFLMENL